MKPEAAKKALDALIDSGIDFAACLPDSAFKEHLRTVERGVQNRLCAGRQRRRRRGHMHGGLDGRKKTGAYHGKHRFRRDDLSFDAGSYRIWSADAAADRPSGRVP